MDGIKALKDYIALGVSFALKSSHTNKYLCRATTYGQVKVIGDCDSKNQWYSHFYAEKDGTDNAIKIWQKDKRKVPVGWIFGAHYEYRRYIGR